jgi:hypothetical protein
MARTSTPLRILAVLLGVAVVVTGSAVPASAASWRPWTNLGKPPGGGAYQGAPTIAARTVGAVDVFKKNDSGVWHRAWWPAGGWGGWGNLGAPPNYSNGGDVSAPSAVGRPGGRLSVVIVNRGDIWHKSYEPGADWSGWEYLGHPPTGVGSAPAVSSRPNGVVDVWVRDNSFRLQHRHWQAGYGWSPWENLGGFVVRAAPAAVGAANGNVWVAVVGNDTDIYHRVWSPSSGWSPWYNSGAPSVSGGYPSPAIAARTNGVIDIFAHGGASGSLSHRWRSPSGSWSGWGSLGGDNIDTAPSAVGRPNGALDVVVGLTDNTVWHRGYW